MTIPYAFVVPARLVHLSAVDVIIVVFYFALVLAIGFYLRGRANTGEDFFMAGREMTAWVAGLSFLSANLGGFVRVHDRADERRQYVRHGQSHADRLGLGHQFQHLGVLAHGGGVCDAR